jgi:hypothetical protein
MITKQELRIGNLLNYDTGEGIYPAKIDWQDLKHISENEEDFNKYHKPIPITQETLTKIGFKNIGDGWFGIGKFTWNIFDKSIRYRGFHLGEPDYIHQVQNLYFAIENEELSANL